MVSGGSRISPLLWAEIHAVSINYSLNTPWNLPFFALFSSAYPLIFMCDWTRGGWEINIEPAGEWKCLQMKVLLKLKQCYQQRISIGVFLKKYYYGLAQSATCSVRLSEILWNNNPDLMVKLLERATSTVKDLQKMSLWSLKWIPSPRGSFRAMIYTSSHFLHAWISQSHCLDSHRPLVRVSSCGKLISCLLDRVRVLLTSLFSGLCCLGDFCFILFFGLVSFWWFFFVCLDFLVVVFWGPFWVFSGVLGCFGLVFFGFVVVWFSVCFGFCFIFLGLFFPPQRNNQLFPYLCEISFKNLFIAVALCDPLERAGKIMPGTGWAQFIRVQQSQIKQQSTITKCMIDKQQLSRWDI